MGNDEDGSRASAVPLKQYLCDKFPSTKIFDHHQGLFSHVKIVSTMNNNTKSNNTSDYIFRL
jgi:hypothetical protein